MLDVYAAGLICISEYTFDIVISFQPAYKVMLVVIVPVKLYFVVQADVVYQPVNTYPILDGLFGLDKVSPFSSCTVVAEGAPV